MGRRSDLISLFKQGIVPGKKIWCNLSSGFDGWEGSENWPYQHILRAQQDLRNGYGDAVIVDMTGTTIWQEDPVVFSGIDGFAIFRAGPSINFISNVLDPTTQSGTTEPIHTITSITRINIDLFEVTTSVVHGLLEGMSVLFADVTQTGTNYINGFKRVDATPTTTTFRCKVDPQTLSDSFEPFFSSTGFGIAFTMPITLDSCDEALVDGLSFDQFVLDFSPDHWGGLAVVQDLRVDFPATNRISLLNLTVKRASVGFGNLPVTQTFRGTGGRLEISGCGIGPSLASIHANAINRKMGSIYLEGGFDYVVEDNQLIYDATVSGPEPWAPEGVIQWTAGATPGFGVLIALNLFPPATGKFGVSRTKLFKDWHEFQEGTGARIFAKRNFFSGIEVIQDVAMDSEGFLVDREPQTIVGQNLLATHSDLVWERNAAGAGAVVDTMGEVTVLGLYAQGVHYDGTASNTNTVLGVDGTRSNPVSSEAALRALSDAVGHKLINVANGTLTLAQAWNDYRFFGEIGPEECVVALGGQDCDGTAFERMKLTGALGGVAANFITGKDVIIEDVTGLKGTYSGDVLILGGSNAMAASGSTFRAGRLLSPQAPFGAAIDIGGGGRTFIASLVSGAFFFTNLDSGTPVSVLGLVLLGASITLNSTSVGGLLTLSGIHNEPLVLGGATLSSLSADKSIGRDQLAGVPQVVGTINDASPTALDFNGDSGLSAIDDYYNGMVLAFRDGALAGIPRVIEDYTGATRNIVLARAFPATPANGDEFTLMSIELFEAAAGGGDWTSGERENIRQALGVAGTKAATAGGDVQNIQSRIPAALVSGRIDASVGAMAANVLTAAAMAADALAAIQAGLAKTTEVNAARDSIKGSPARDISEIAGATFSAATDSLEAIRNRGDAAWLTAVGFSTPGDVTAARDVITGSPALSIRDLGGATFAGATDSQEAIRNRGDLSWVTAVGFATPGDLVAVIAAIQGTGGLDLTDLGGLGFVTGTDSLEALRNRGDAAWATAIGFATPGDVTAARDAVIARGDLAWVTAVGFATAGDVAADGAITRGAGFVVGTHDLVAIAGLIAGLNNLSAAAAADAVLDELLAGHTTANSLGAAITEIVNHVVGRALIDITTTPWLERRFVRAASPPDTVEVETYELYDQDGVAISGDETAGNNPIADNTVLIAERRRI